MPDATDNKVTVDGVEPSILVQYVDNADSNDVTSSYVLWPTDGGGDRRIVKGGAAVHVTEADLALLSGAVLEYPDEEAPDPKVSQDHRDETAPNVTAQQTESSPSTPARTVGPVTP